MEVGRLHRVVMQYARDTQEETVAVGQARQLVRGVHRPSIHVHSAQRVLEGGGGGEAGGGEQGITGEREE